jgi:hypothetical protein
MEGSGRWTPSDDRAGTLPDRDLAAARHRETRKAETIALGVAIGGAGILWMIVATRVWWRWAGKLAGDVFPEEPRPDHARRHEPSSWTMKVNDERAEPRRDSAPP